MVKKKLLLLLLLLPLWMQAQVVTPVPAFLTEDASAEIIFDATGTGLDGYSGDDVYAHTGVITDKSASLGDWKYAPSWLDNNEKYKLISLGNNKWKLKLSPTIHSYYGVASGEKVQKLAFVFRNEDGSKEGKDNGKDIFVDVKAAGLQVVFEKPTSDLLIDINTTVDVEINTSEATTIQLLNGKDILKKVENATTLSYSYKFTTEGTFSLIAQAGITPNVVSESIEVTVKKATTSKPLPAGARAGINCVDDSTATFVLYAPHKNNVYLIGDFNDWKVDNKYMMNRAGDYWWITLSDLEKGREYAFQYLVDGSLKIADPYTNKILDPWNDSYIPASVYPNLKAYPTGKAEGIVSVVQTGQKPYEWKNTNFVPESKEKLVIYELLIRDFTKEHSFASTMQKLDYLQSLGINAIELLPINEFEGNSSWGYNPSFYFAVDKYYGTSDAFRAFVDECHRRGMAVIIDMVLNHSYGQSPFVRLYWDNANNRPAKDNPWYNVESPNSDYSWGYDFNHESDQTKALVDSINCFWMKEYKVDGFRFDFTKGFTNKPGDGWAYDQSRIDILKRMTNEIYKRNPNAFVIMEHLADNSEEKVLSSADIMLWGNMNHNYCEAIMGYTEDNKTDLSWAVYSKRGWTDPNLVAYMESHDEERMMFKAKEWGKVKDQKEALKRAELSAAFYLTLPGAKMIWQFGELGYDYSINICSDGKTISDDCRVAEKPIRWDYFEDADRKALYNAYSKLIELKKKKEVFESLNMVYSLEGAQKYIIWQGEKQNAFLVGNFDIKEASVNITLPRKGQWIDALTGKTVSIESVNYNVSLKPGEYQLFLDNGVETSIEEPRAEVAGIRISDDYIDYEGEVVRFITIYNLLGSIQKSKSNAKSVNISDLPQGAYILKIETDKKVISRKFMKQ